MAGPSERIVLEREKRQLLQVRTSRSLSADAVACYGLAYVLATFSFLAFGPCTVTPASPSLSEGVGGCFLFLGFVLTKFADRFS